MAELPVDDEAALAEALFRYRLIADAVNAPPEARASILAEVADAEHVGEGGEVVRVSRRSLGRWLDRYQADKLAGLVRRPRKDKGTLRGLTLEALERAILHRREEPARSTRTLIDILERSGQVAEGALKRSTLDRHLDRKDASRRRMGVLGAKRHVRLAFDHPLDFVVGDFHVGPYVRVEGDRLARARLAAFIDHCSRYLPESRYVLAEDLMAVRRGLRALFAAHGRMRRLYVDNGAAYQAVRLAFACAQLDIELCHSRPYVSEGRGVIERFNRTTKESFEVEVRLRREPPTLDELNGFWRAWREERYHSQPHGETGEPPAERWARLLATTEVRAADPVLVDELLRLLARRKVHKKTSTIEVGGVAFVVDTALRGRWVNALWDPHDLSSVLVYFDGRRIERATPQRPGESPVAAPAPPTRPPPSVDYLELLRRDHERRRKAEVAAIRFRPTADESALLTLPRLVDRLRVLCGRALGQVEAEHAAALLGALAPLEVALADTALQVATATLGRGLHASQYLDALRAHVLRARRKGTR
jgi:putative transposase